MVHGVVVGSWDRHGVRHLAVRITEQDGSGTEYSAGIPLAGLSDEEQESALIGAVTRVVIQQRGQLLQVAGFDPVPWMFDIRKAILGLPPTGGVVDVPAGVFRIAEPLPIRNGLILRGSGMYATRIICDGPGGMVAVGNTRIGGVNISEMEIIGKGAGVGLDLTDVDRSMFERVRIEGFPLGVRVTSNIGAYHNLFLQCHVGGGYLLTNAPNKEGPNSTRIIGGETRQDNGTAIRVDCGNNIVIEAVAIEGTTQVGVDAPGLDSDSHRANVAVIGCRFELNVTPSIALKFGPHAYDCRAYANFIASNVTPLVDAGTRTITDVTTNGNTNNDTGLSRRRTKGE